MASNDNLAALIDERLARKWRALGALVSTGASSANGFAKNGTPGLINTEFAEPGIIPTAITARSIVRKVRTADLTGITNAGSSVGLLVPVLAGETWIVNGRIFSDSAAASVGGYSLTWVTPATTLYRFAVNGIPNSATNAPRRLGTAVAGTPLTPFGNFDSSASPNMFASEVTLTVTVSAAGNLDLQLAAVTGGETHSVRAGSFVIAHRVS